MLLRSWSRRQVTAHLGEARRLSTSRVTRSQGPNARLELDQSFNEFMKNSSDMRSWKAQTDRATSHAENTQHSPRELEVYPEDHLTSDRYLSPEELDSLEAEDEKHSRKSPAALFGSQRHGTIVVPLELQRTITKLISGSDKPMLHLDAKRLFLDENGDQAQWDPSYDVRYKTRRQAHQHAERDGTAFASVALPSHYAAIVAVLDHVKQRLGPSWNAHHVIDWGSGTGSGLWAAAHVFQKPPTPDSSSEPVDAQIMNSTVATYLGLDKREGLVSIGRRLLKDVELGDLKVTWKQAFQESHKVPYVEGNGVVALSAFMLSSVQSPLARKALVMEMWESGADTIVIIDHSTPAGFEAIAMAREALLRIGRKPSEDPEIDSPPLQGCHVVAPCPHDQACPLYHPGSKRLLCGFSQRLQRPEFVRKTKHSGQGHEDTGYSYVVIRRGPRPAATEHKAGRIGEVGKREMQKIAQKDKRMTELTVDGEHPPTTTAISGTDVADTTSISQETGILEHSDIQMAASSEEMEEALRSEAYHWPRLVYPPLKKSGHIILDSCTAEGKIMRLTIPRSQGKQPFYDARKSTWGDIFPHEPKNRPQEKHSPPGTKSSGNPVSSQPNGKGSKHDDRRHKSYSRLAEELNENKKRMRKQKQFAMKGDLW